MSEIMSKLVVKPASDGDSMEEKIGKGLGYGLGFGTLYGLTSAYWGNASGYIASSSSASSSVVATGIKGWSGLVPYVAKHGALCGGVGAGYYLGEGIMSNMTAKEGAWINGFAGGCTAGAVMTLGTTKLKLPGLLAVVGVSGIISGFVKQKYD